MPRCVHWAPRKLQLPVWDRHREPHWHARNISPQSLLWIVDAEALIFEEELADLGGFRQEAEAIDPVSAFEAELSGVCAEVAQLKGVGRPIYFVAQRQTGLPHEGGCSDSSHANAGSSRVECVVGRTSCRLARRICCRETTFVLWKSTETTGGDMVFRECVLERPRTQDHVCCGDTAGG